MNNILDTIQLHRLILNSEDRKEFYNSIKNLRR